MIQNDNLLKLYQDKYPVLSKMIEDKNFYLQSKGRDKYMATNPLLLKSSESYNESDYKIMFFGQETNIWLKEINNGVFNGGVTPVINLYERFYLRGGYYKYGGQFWNGFKLFKNKVNKAFVGKKVEFIWNNIEKIGQCKKGFPYAINEITTKYFKVIQEEVEILRPDLLLFLTGPNYDSSIIKNLGRFEIKEVHPFKTRELCEIIIPHMPRAFRTYHPNYLWRSKSISNTFNRIIDLLNN